MAYNKNLLPQDMWNSKVRMFSERDFIRSWKIDVPMSIKTNNSAQDILKLPISKIWEGLYLTLQETATVGTWLNEYLVWQLIHLMISNGSSMPLNRTQAPSSIHREHPLEIIWTYFHILLIHHTNSRSLYHPILSCFSTIYSALCWNELGPRSPLHSTESISSLWLSHYLKLCNNKI